MGLKRGYFVHIKDEGAGEAVIATSNQEAKKLRDLLLKILSHIYLSKLRQRDG